MSLKLVGPECTPLVMPNYCPIDAQFAPAAEGHHLLAGLSRDQTGDVAPHRR